MFSIPPIVRNFVSLFIIASAGALIATPLHAQVAGLVDASCAVSEDDTSVELPTLITEASNKYGGRCLDSDLFRPAVLHDSQDGAFVFSNYFHNNKYWQATIPASVTWDSIYVHVVRFQIVAEVTAAHVQIRGKLAEGNEISLMNSAGETTTVSDVVVSFEAARPKDEKYNFALGMANNYLLVGRVASGLQRSKEYGDEFATEQYRLNINDENQRKDLILAAIQKSAQRGTTHFYNTLKPNCTTEVFEVIDSMEFLDKNSFPPFLVEASIDPVAGPTIQAIKDRGLYAERVANLKDELNGITKKPTEMQEEPKAFLFPKVQDYPYAMVQAAFPNTPSPDLDRLKKELYSLLPQFMIRLSTSQMLGKEDASLLLISSLKELSKELKTQLTSLESQLIGPATTLSIHLSPWDESVGTSVDALKELGVPARLPFNTYEVNYDFEAMNTVHMGLNDANTALANKQVPFGLMGVVIKMHLEKNGKSYIKMQVAAHTGSLDKELIVTNDQVNISSVIIPDGGYSAPHLHPMALIHFSQNISEDVPSFFVEFGNLGGVVYETASPDLGEFYLSEEDRCEDRANASPALKGTAAKLSLVDAWLQIFSVDFDLENLLAKNVEVRTTTGVFDIKTGLVKGCERDEEINALFTDSVNAQLKEQKDKLSASPGLSLLGEILSNNKEGVIPGQ